MRTYTARISRDGKWWLINVPDLDLVTQARRIADIEEMTRSLIAVSLDVAPSSFELHIELEAIEDLDLTSRVEQLDTDRANLAELQVRVSERSRSLARDMAGKGLTVRDIGAVLGVSYQRAQQLVDA